MSPAADNDQIPPYNLEAEESLLGAMLLSPPAIDSATEANLTPSDFYKPAHGHIFDAVTSLHAKGQRADPVTVADHLLRLELLDAVGGGAVLISLQSGTPSTTNAAQYARIVAEHSTLRRLISVAAEVNRIGYSVPEDVAAAVAAARALLHSDTFSTAGNGFDPALFASAGSWVLDRPPGIPAVWGDGDRILWAKGEPLLIVGPPGVGKSSIAQQLVRAMTGLGEAEVLGMPVAPASKVLYIAADRPQQIARGFARSVVPSDRQLLDERLAVWQGPPPKDFARNPGILVDMARAAGAEVVVIDSLKDVALGLSDDETGAGLNQCLQRAVAAGIEVVTLHHQRKGQNGTKPKGLEDVFGSTWITAGAGSVVLLWGKAGDLVIRLEHLKQPGAPVGPLDILHDHDAGRSTVERVPVDALVVLVNARTGLTGPDLARLAGEGEEPKKTDIQRARRDLNQLVSKGLARREEPIRGGDGGSSPARYFAVDHHHEEEF